MGDIVDRIREANGPPKAWQHRIQHLADEAVVEIERLRSSIACEKRMRKDADAQVTELQEGVVRLRDILARMVRYAPGAFRGGEPDTGQYSEWFAALHEAARAAEEENDG